MGKIYKGYELMKAIADEEIKEGTIFKCKLGKSNKGFEREEEYIYENENIVTHRNLRTNKMGIYCDYSIKQFANGIFELIEDEIDIDSIEEIKFRPSDKEYLGFCGLIFEEKINKLVQAVKQLNKKAKEMENERC